MKTSITAPSGIARSIHKGLLVGMLVAAPLFQVRAEDAAPASTSSVQATLTSTAKPVEYPMISFEQLANFTFVPPEVDESTKPGSKELVAGEAQIPGAVKELDGRKVMLSGFMMPVKMENGMVTEMLLMRNQMACCYGGVPNMNEWVVVHMGKHPVKALMDTPVFLYGTMKVGTILDNGFVAGIYQMDGVKMEQ